MKIKIPGKTAVETGEIVKACAREVGDFAVRNDRTAGNYFFFVLRMAQGAPPKRDRVWAGKADTRKLTPAEDERYHKIVEGLKFRKRGIGSVMWGRGPEYGVAVCFHGFREFMRAVYAKHPDAVIRTAWAAYLGSEDFEDKWPGTGSQNVGSQMCPVAYSECCDC